TLARSGAEAEQAASAAIDADLGTVGSSCTAPTVDIDVSAFSAPPGQGGDVVAAVTCEVPFTDLLIPMPGALTVKGRAGSRLDSFRERQP
ncbi:hypothetical protein HMPREF0682_0013, partial [Propionibacterium acidifaciens F0233]